MSTYIVNRDTINAIVKGLEMYRVDLIVPHYETYMPDMSIDEIRNMRGQLLIKQNYDAANARYPEKVIDDIPDYEYSDVDINDGVLVGCINCYIYQVGDAPDFFQSDIYFALGRIKSKILAKLIAEKGLPMPWGYEEFRREQEAKNGTGENQK